ncbi:hypothetical protein G195_003489 [Phytophthora kernoviae 00238/432]|uniref:ABC transporter domain-containing protein n=1 Tax=Phytophthora kernoviae 00238/432 TaxID=1284355 RepID=A0A8J4W8L1_9STRA|nr:hypothetical protein G195_003489 [Phytophthora kernoviae 00238/432]
MGVYDHTDFGALTVLLQDDEVTTLQAFHRESQTWTNVPPRKGTYTINIGDMVQIWSNDQFKAPPHRVLASDKGRYSVPFFYNPSYKSQIESIVVKKGDVANVRVLLWKNWRIKQRESRFNRGRTGRRWLFPALVTDIILPLGLLLLLIQKLCEYNAQLVTPLDVGNARIAQGIQPPGQADEVLKTQREMRETAGLLPTGWGEPQEMKQKSAALLLAALPLLLEKSNQSLAVLERTEGTAFLDYLDREYPEVEELGISSFLSKTKKVPFESGSNEEADQVLLGFPKKSGLHIYAGLDVRRTSGDGASQSLELLALFYQKRPDQDSRGMRPIDSLSQDSEKFSDDEAESVRLTEMGPGYKLTVVHHEDPDQDDEHSQLNDARRQARAELLMTTLKKFVPNATIVSDNKWETRVQLNNGEERRFAELFGELDIMKQSRIIRRYAIAATNLEDHLASSGGFIETVTTLPPSAKETSLLVSSASKVADSVADIVAQFEQSSNPIVFDRSATTEQAMLNTIARENTTTFFAGVFVSDVNWTSGTPAASTGMAYSLYYNETVRRSLPVTLQLVAQAYCKALAKHGGIPGIDSCNLVAKRGIFPIDVTIGDDVTTEKDNLSLDPDETINVVRRIMVAFYLLVTMSSVVSYYIAPIVKEKENGLKRLQFMHLESENASLLYWASNFLFDYTAYILAAIAMITILAVFSASLTTDILAAWLISMVLFGLAIMPFLYVCSLVFSSHSSAQSYMSYVSLFQIMAASIVFALSMVPGLCINANTITYFLQVLPLYTFGVLILNIVTVSWAPMRQQCLDISDGLDSLNMFTALDAQSSVWDWDVTGSNWFVLVASAMGYALLLLLMDQKQMYPTLVEHKTRRALRWMQHRFLPCWGSHGQGYMEAEQTGVSFDEENPNTDMARVLRVSKIFNPRKKNASRGADEHQEGEGSDNGESAAAVVNESGQVVALDDVSFSVEKSDCVALLGVNGSGKSTMFEILTAGTAPTSGKALIDKCDVTVEPQAASARYGYCPQGNIFFSEMSVREHLELFYRLRCRRRDALLSEAAVINALLQRLDLLPVEQTAAGHLSGGNKRRLMLALALLSEHTSLLLLDEPSAGVDVVARRLMWRVLREKRESQHRTSCLFTTHSMEEAEAVCANAVVLFKGKLVWYGSIPDLKQRVSRGITISVRLDSTAIWKPEQVQFYTEQIRRSHESRPSSNALSTTLERASLPLRELEDAWELCHGLLHQDGDAATSAASRQHAKNWLANLRSRFESDDSEVTTATSSVNQDKIQPVIPIVEFVQEWLIQEAFAVLETQLFKEEISSRSGEPVSPVDLETAHGSGSNTSGVYETSCTDKFGLADAFALLEDAKPRFKISHYSISEMSLERVFEQFT